MGLLSTTSSPEAALHQMVSSRPKLIGWLSALCVFFIWSGFFVLSRAGVQSGLTAYDVTMLRFVVATVAVLPFASKWWPTHLPVRVQAIMALCGPGALYTTLMYLGLTNASAAWGGVFANGSLPIFTMLVAFVIGGTAIDRHQVFPIALVIIGSVLVSLPGFEAGGASVAKGILLFLCASAVLSVYIFGVRHWNVSPKEALILVTLPNAVIYAPLWYFFFPSDLATAETSTILFQAVFQGLGPGFIAVILFAISAKNLGPTPTAGFSAAVPAGAALLAVPVLSEYLATIEWAGIGVVSVGLVLLIVRPFDRERVPPPQS